MLIDERQRRDQDAEVVGPAKAAEKAQQQETGNADDVEVARQPHRLGRAQGRRQRVQAVGPVEGFVLRPIDRVEGANPYPDGEAQHHHREVNRPPHRHPAAGGGHGDGDAEDAVAGEGKALHVGISPKDITCNTSDFVGFFWNHFFNWI